MNNLSVSISIVVAICAIISPILTAIINNHYQYKLRKLDDEKELRKTSAIYKRDVLENYLKYLGQCHVRATADSEANYGKYYFLAYLYAPSDVLPLMEEIDKHYSNHDFYNKDIPLETVAFKLREHINSL